jgi:tetratricopeptide (TPR) repeat protein
VSAAVAAAWPRLTAQRLHWAVAASLGAVLALGAWRSHDRTKIWRDNQVLLDQSVKDAPLSYRAHYLRGGALLIAKQFAAAEREYRQAVDLFPMDPTMTASLASELSRDGRCPSALPLYALANRADPQFVIGRMGYAACLLRVMRLDEARAQALEALRYGAATPGDVRRLLQVAAEAKRSLAGRAPGRSDSIRAALPTRRKMPERVQNTSDLRALRAP